MEPEQINSTPVLQSSVVEEQPKKPSKILVYLLFILIIFGVASWAGVYMKSQKQSSVPEVPVVVADNDFISVTQNQVYLNWQLQKGIKVEDFKKDSFLLKKIDTSYNLERGCDTQIGEKVYTNQLSTARVCLSSGVEPDSGLYLAVEGESKLKLLTSCGTPCLYEEGFWLDNTRFVLLWTLNDYEYENNMKPYLEFHIDIYDIRQNIISTWNTGHKYN